MTGRPTAGRGPSKLALELHRLIQAHPEAPLAWLGAVLAAGDARLPAEPGELAEGGRAPAGTLEEATGGARVADVSPVRMRIFDTAQGTAAVVPIDPGDPGRGSVVVRGERLVGPLRRLFERYRSTASTDWAPLVGRRREIVQLMAEGRTDRAIAARLGVSLRTITREITSLMQEVGAISRFQLGQLLADDNGRMA